MLRKIVPDPHSGDWKSSINQSIDQSIDQSINQSINHTS